MEKIKFQSEDGIVEFYVEEQTTIAGITYLLVSDSQDDEANAYILKDISEKDSQEACYEMILPVVMWDERLTTVEANRTLMESGVRRENRKQYLDELAAIFILQSYLDAYGREDAVREVNI